MNEMGWRLTAAKKKLVNEVSLFSVLGHECDATFARLARRRVSDFETAKGDGEHCAHCAVGSALIISITCVQNVNASQTTAC